ncbi:hypothetical protein AB0M43_16670 [Longispora sp. NPDC051575]|uniref:hypothetical protein n=1 Tax=Longispora sp. NPDC051575 TaxID=3154943 RepID=UPI003445CF3D
MGMRASRALVVLALLALPACTSTPAAGPTPAVTASPSPGATAPAPTGFGTQMVLVRTGGLKGGSDMWTITADGGWRRTDPAGKQVKATGTLTREQLGDLTRKLTDPALAAELRADARPGTCPDGIDYILNSGPASGIVPGCGLESPTPHIVELAEFVGRVTATN